MFSMRGFLVMLANSFHYNADLCAPHLPFHRRPLPSDICIENRRSWGIGSIF